MGTPTPLPSKAMATIEHRGESIRVTWRLGGTRSGARQSCTFSGTLRSRVKLAEAAKHFAESRDHNVSRDDVYAAILGKAAAGPQTVPTFEQWMAEWLEGRRARREIQPDVLDKYEQALRSRALPYLGRMRLDAINADVLRGWVGYMSSQKITLGSKNRITGDRLLSAESIRRTHAILHACLGAAVPRWLPANPAARPSGSRQNPSGLPKPKRFDSMFLLPSEVQRILDCCSPHIRDMALVAYRSGLRLGELCALPVRNVVFSPRGATIKVRVALKNGGALGVPKSEMSRRDVPVGSVAAEALRARVAGHRLDDLVFPSPSGLTWCENNFNNRFWKPAVAEARRCAEHPPTLPPKPARGPRRKLRLDEVSVCGCEGVLSRAPRFHDLRHSHASVLIEQGWSMKKVQIRLGHASYQTTAAIYAHVHDAGSDAELDALDAHLDVG